DELRLTGGAARSRSLRAVLAASIGAPVRVSAREEAGAAGAAMMAAVAIGAYEDMECCIAQWVTPLLGAAEAPDTKLQRIYERDFKSYALARRALEPVWQSMADNREAGIGRGVDAREHTEQTMDAAGATEGSA
ncbi:MAG: carbohydrate kinase, partial [Paracoccus sp.]|nr:carbohydrate kinase [Paracoccus sp. (in: a-proteobacteria)]